MKKFALITAIVALSATVLSSCGTETFVCDSCQQEVTSKKYTTEFLGVEMNICEDCNKEMEAANEALENLGDLDLGDLGL